MAHVSPIRDPSVRIGRGRLASPLGEPQITGPSASWPQIIVRKN
jgi:hypothetical protein